MTQLPETVRLSIERKQMTSSRVSPTPSKDGVYETLTADLEVQHFVIRNGERRDITEGWALRYVCDEAGPDSKTRKKRDASVYRERRRMRRWGFLRQAAFDTLSETSGGMRVSIDLSGKPGIGPTAETQKVGVGKKAGWTIYETRHFLTGSEEDFVAAFLALGAPTVDDLIVMRAEVVETVAGESTTDPRRVWKLQCIRQAQSGAEAVERFMVDDLTDWIIAPTHKGAKAKLRNLLKDRENERRAKEKAEAERVTREAVEAEKKRIADSAASVAAIDEDDLDALGSMQ